MLVLVATLAFLWLRQAGATLQLRCMVFSLHGFCCGAGALGHGGCSSCSSRALEHRRNSHGAWAELRCRMWDLPGPGTEPVSPALAGRFFTTEPPSPPLSVETRLWVRAGARPEAGRSMRSDCNKRSKRWQGPRLLCSSGSAQRWLCSGYILQVGMYTWFTDREDVGCEKDRSSVILRSVT